jgi:type 1 glutamine amidotransferase
MIRSLAVLALGLCAAGFAAAEDAKPLRVLLVTGGCCHDYAKQRLILAEGLGARANVEVTFEHTDDKTTKYVFPIYKNADWAKPFDVVIHDECSADVTDPTIVSNILNAHKAGTPAVNLHCAMHSYRWGAFRDRVAAGADNAGWYEFLGLQSFSHGPQQPIAISFVDKDHAITKGLSDWTTINEELYNNAQILGGHALARGTQDFTNKKTSQPVHDEAVVAWTNEYGEKKTRVFSTTLGHNNDTVADARYLDLVARGVLWAAGKLDADGNPVAGFGPKKK